MTQLRLPLLKLVTDPFAAFTELAEQPSAALPVGFGTAVVAIVTAFEGVSRDSLTVLRNRFPSHPLLTDPTFWRIAMIPLSYLLGTLNAFCIHVAASQAKPHERFTKFWGAYFFISAVDILYLIPHGGPISRLVLMIPLGLWKLALICIALNVIYDLSVGRAIFSVISGYFLAALPIIGMIVIGVVVAVYPLARSLPSARSAAGPILTPTHMPADFGWALQAPDGTSHPMADYKGRVIVLNFWATWCGPCQAEMPALQKLSDKLGREKFAVVGVTNESADVLKTYVSKHSYTFPLYSSRNVVPPVFESAAIPMTFIISEDGVVVSKREGAVRWDDPEITSYLQSLVGKRFPGADLQTGDTGSAGTTLLIHQAEWAIKHSDFAQARRYLETAQARLATEPIPRPFYQGLVYNDLGNIKKKEGRHQEALALHLQAIEALKKSPESRPGDVVTAIRNAQSDYYHLKRPGDARALEHDVYLIQKADKNK